MFTRIHRPSRVLSTGCVLASAILWMAAPAGARAQATLDGDSLHTEADAFFYDPGFFYFGNGWSHADSPVQGTDWSNDSFSKYENTGFAGDAHSHNTTSYNPSSPGVGGTFSQIRMNLKAESNITASDLTGNHYFEDSYGIAWSNINFTIDQPSIWNWVADVKGACSPNGWDNHASTWFRIYDITATTNYVDSRFESINGNADYAQHVDLSGELQPGKYLIWIRVLSDVANFSEVGGGTGSASSSLDGLFTIRAVPAASPAALAGLAALFASRRRR